MLMRNPEYQVEDRVETKRGVKDSRLFHTPLEMLLGQMALMLLLIIAILLREMA